MQFPTSLAARASQRSPQWFGSLAMERRRYRWPTEWEHPPQSDQVPHVQSWQSLSPEHGVPLHSPSSESGPSHAGPLLAFCTRMWRIRRLWPLSHEAEHAPHGAQGASVQGRGSPGPHRPPACASLAALELHGVTSLRGFPTHALPLPVASSAIPRWRSLMPAHEELHVDHSFHAVSWQSRDFLHGVSLQSRYSSSKPLAGSPQLFGYCATSRWRAWKPWSHVALQLDQLHHSPHMPSRHTVQDSVLQAATSDLLPGVQSLPPCLGAYCTMRLLRIVPPPQEHEHPLQSSHVLQRQSIGVQLPTVHAFTNLSGNALAACPRTPASITFRSRVAEPTLQGSSDEQGPQSDHSERWKLIRTWQSWCLQ